MSQSWRTGEVVAAVLAFPAAIAALFAIVGVLRKCYHRRTHHNTAQDIEPGTLGAAQIGCDPNSMPDLQQRVIQPLERAYLARYVSQPSSVRMQPSEEHDLSVLRLRHLAPVPEDRSSSVTTTDKHEARFQQIRQSHQSIANSLEVFATWTSLESRTREVEDQIAREKTEWQEERRSRDSPSAAFSSLPDLS